MAAALPGPRLRPHVKAHKSTALAPRGRPRPATAGSRAPPSARSRAWPRPAWVEDLLLANEVVDARRLGAVVDAGAGSPSPSTPRRRSRPRPRGGVREVVIDVNVGTAPLRLRARRRRPARRRGPGRGLEVRGVMGYEGHVVGLDDRAERARQDGRAGDGAAAAPPTTTSAASSSRRGGTGTYDINTWATEIQAGSYALMDTAYAKLGLPFRQALTVLATVISVSPDGWAVADCGLKALGMDHGNPTHRRRQGVVLLRRAHHVRPPTRRAAVGDRIRVVPAHVDPTVAFHERIHVVRDDEVVDIWPVDLRGW